MTPEPSKNNTQPSKNETVQNETIPTDNRTIFEKNVDYFISKYDTNSDKNIDKVELKKALQETWVNVTDN